MINVNKYIANLQIKYTVKFIAIYNLCSYSRNSLIYKYLTYWIQPAFLIFRRGKPEVIMMISDNGTNFTSAERELLDLVSTLDQTRIKEQVAHDEIQW